MSEQYFVSGKFFPATTARPFLIHYADALWITLFTLILGNNQPCEFPHMCMLLRLNWILKWTLCRSPGFCAQFSSLQCSALMNSSHLGLFGYSLYLPHLVRASLPPSQGCALKTFLGQTVSGAILGFIFVSHFSGIIGFYCLMLNNLSHCLYTLPIFFLDRRLNTVFFTKWKSIQHNSLFLVI